MKINDFKVEVFFGVHEFTAKYLLSSSDAESMSIEELLAYEPGAKEKFMNSWLGYTEVPGDPELRAEIARLYQTINPDQVIVHAGAEEVIFNFMRTVLSEGDHAIVLCPAYQSLYEVAASIGCEVSKWQLKASNGRWHVDMNELETMIKPNTKLICINSPHNPTGYVFSRAEMDQIVALAKKNERYVFCDEVYRGIEMEGETRPMMADLYDKAVSLGVMSKTYGLPGLRIGWAATKDPDVLEKLTKAKHYTTICSSGPSEFLSIIAIKHGEKIIARNKAILNDNLKIADEFFAKYKNLFEYSRPMGGTIGFIKMNIKKPIHEFCVDMVNEKGVLLISADTFDTEGQYFRMGFGRKNFPICLQKFEEYLIEKKEDLR